MLYAGRAAEVKLKGSIENATAGASADIQQATKIASSYVSIEEGIDYSLFGELGAKKILELSQELLKSVWKETQTVIEEKWEYVDLIAKELMRTEYISKEDFVKLINEYDEKLGRKKYMLSKEDIKELITDKKDVCNHGIGSKSIADIVKKNDGKVIYSVKNGWFITELLI